MDLVAQTRRPAERSFASGLRLRLLGLETSEVTFARRGFPSDVAGVRERLERAGGAFAEGYNAALRDRHDIERLIGTLNDLEADLHGFAHEGAAMAMAIVDSFSFGRSRWRALFDLAGKHSYLLLVGAGWAMARLRRRSIPSFVRGVQHVAEPLVWDGYGFHEGFFHPQRFIRAMARPPLRGYELRGFDQGLGRSLWFVEGASPSRIAATIGAFDLGRRADLWSGVGLACAYAGGVDRAAIEQLLRGAGGHEPSFAQGVVFAAAARERAGNLDEAVALACDVACGMDATAAAAVANEELERSREGSTTPRYESWRQRIAARFAAPREE